MGIYLEAFYHFVWATRKREHFITEDVERALYRYIQQRCETLDVPVHATNGMPDHVHLVATLPARLAPAEFMETIKGASAHHINHLPETRNCLYWQPGYGLLTLTRQALPRIVQYVDAQKTHHASGTLHMRMEWTADWEANS